MIREHLRVTIEPLDLPNAERAEQVLEHLGSDEMLLFGTDYPHWQFDDPAEAWPYPLAPASLDRLLRSNAVVTYDLDRQVTMAPDR